MKIDPQTYVALKTSTPIVIDGRLDDPAWELAPWTNDFQDIEGDKQPKPTYRTRAKILWDDTCLYMGFELEEPHIWATLTEHDSIIFQDNDIEIFIDPDGDGHEYYEFEMNALGTYWDLLLTKPYKDGGTAVNGWESKGIQCAAWVDGTINDPSDTDKRWTAEVAFTWESLKECARVACPPEEGDQWPINFSRVEWDIVIEDGKYKKVPNRPEHNWVWSPQGEINMHRPETWGLVQFSSQPTAFRSDPTLATKTALYEVYYAQKAYREKTGRYATSVQELGLSLPVKIEATTNLFEATCEGLCVDHEARLRKAIR